MNPARRASRQLTFRVLEKSVHRDAVDMTTISLSVTSSIYIHGGSLVKSNSHCPNVECCTDVTCVQSSNRAPEANLSSPLNYGNLYHIT